MLSLRNSFSVNENLVRNSVTHLLPCCPPCYSFLPICAFFQCVVLGFWDFEDYCRQYTICLHAMQTKFSFNDILFYPHLLPTETLSIYHCRKYKHFPSETHSAGRVCTIIEMSILDQDVKLQLKETY